MSREAFLFFGVCVLMIAIMQGEDFFERAARGAIDYGRLLAMHWTIMFAAMLLTWWYFPVSV